MKFRGCLERLQNSCFTALNQTLSSPTCLRREFKRAIRGKEVSGHIGVRNLPDSNVLFQPFHTMLYFTIFQAVTANISSSNSFTIVFALLPYATKEVRGYP